MTMEPVVSSNIQAIGYDENSQTLDVQFTSGATYEYSGVPKETYDSFMMSDSKGKFFAANIKPVYSCQKVS